MNTAIATPKTRIEVNSRKEAWAIVDQIFPTDYIKDEECSQRAGYPVYRSTAEGHYYDYICDLNDRFEINLSTGKTVNVWFSELYWKFRGIAEDNIALRQKVDDLETEIESLKFMLDLYEKQKHELQDKNAELTAKIEKVFALVSCI